MPDSITHAVACSYFYALLGMTIWEQDFNCLLFLAFCCSGQLGLRQLGLRDSNLVHEVNSS